MNDILRVKIYSVFLVYASNVKFRYSQEPPLTSIMLSSPCNEHPEKSFLYTRGKVGLQKYYNFSYFATKYIIMGTL